MPGFTNTPISIDDVQALIPKPSTLVPASEAAAGNPGTDMAKFSMEGHAHARLTSAHTVTTDSNGVFSVTFTTVNAAGQTGFDNMPCPIINGITVPGVSGTVSWQITNGRYIGATVTCTRRTASTSTTGVSVAGIPVLNGLTTTTNDTPAANTSISAVFLKVST